MAKVPPNQQSTAPPWTGATRTVFMVAFLIIIAGTVSVSTAAMPFAVGSILLAYLLYPFKTFLQKRVFGGRPGPAVGTVVLVVLGVLIITAVLVVPTLIQQSISFIDTSVREANRFMTEPLVINGEVILDQDGAPLIPLQAIREVSEYIFPPEVEAPVSDQLPPTVSSTATPFSEQFLQTMLGLTRNFMSLSFRVVGSVAALALNLLFLMMLLSYFLSDGQQMIESVIELAPDGYERDLRRIFWELGQVWNDYLRGQLILGVLIGVLMWLLAVILGLPNPVFLGVFAGFMEFIPNIGPVLAMIPPILVALYSGSSAFPEMSVFLLVGIIVGVWIIVQQLEGLVFVPRIMGSSLSLHPVVIVLGVVVGGSIGGIIGVILSAPTIATGRILLQYIYGRLAEEPPFRRNANFEKWLKQNAPQLRYEPEHIEAATVQPVSNEPATDNQPQEGTS